MTRYRRDMLLQKWITESPLTVSQVADILGVHRTTLHGYMSGRIMPRRAKIAAIGRLTKGAVLVTDIVAAVET